MLVVRTVAELCEEMARREGPIGLVPTMGALHAGHLALVERAKDECETVVMSIFVNPAQFNDARDLATYPRDEERDLETAAEAGVDVVFLPDPVEMYPRGYATNIVVSGPVAETLEGAKRGRSHFDGVATVVAKLMIASAADAAYFGQKDAQQIIVVQRMVTDLGLPVRVVACPIVRDADGLALSSRNVHLSDEERARALAIPRSLNAIADAVAGGEIDARTLAARALDVLAEAEVLVEYIAFVDPDSLEPVDEIEREVLVAFAGSVGTTRLLDNIVIGPGSGTGEKSR